MLDKDNSNTRENILEYCQDNNVNDLEKFYLLQAFHVDNEEDLKNMLNYVKQDRQRKDILEYCKNNNWNARDTFYLLNAFHVDNKDDLENMLNYLRQADNELPIDKNKDTDGQTKIFKFKPYNESPKKD